MAFHSSNEARMMRQSAKFSKPPYRRGTILEIYRERIIKQEGRRGARRLTWRAGTAHFGMNRSE
jgi:hypothetical protein